MAENVDLRSGGANGRGSMVRFTFDGALIQAFAGETVAAALFAAGVRELRKSPRQGDPRGVFCLMGSCQECAVWVNGRRMLACQAVASRGISVRSADPNQNP